MLLPLIALACSAPADTVPFSSGEVAVRGGVLLPVASLSHIFDPTVQGGASLSMAHWGSVRTRLDLSYARLEGLDKLHYALGGAGYDWRPARFPIELGASLGVFFVQNDPDPDNPRLSDGGETEFGFVLRLGAPVWTIGPWTLRAEAQWQEAFTAPRASVLAWTGLSLSRRAW